MILKRKTIFICTGVIIAFIILALAFYFTWLCYPLNIEIFNENTKESTYTGFNEEIPTCYYKFATDGQSTATLEKSHLLDRFMFRCENNINSALRIDSSVKIDGMDKKEIKDLFYVDGTFYLYYNNGYSQKFNYIKKFEKESEISIYLTDNKNVTLKQITSSLLSSNEPENLAAFFISKPK